MANNEINDLTAKTTPVSTDEVEIQETAGGLSKKATVGNLAKGMSYNDLNDKPSIPTVSDTAYDATTWNGNTDAPTKNAVRDKIESMGGGGDVVGPASSTDNAIARFDLTTGKLIQNSSATISDSGVLTVTVVEVANVQNSGGVNFPDFLTTDFVDESTLNAGVTVDGVLIKDGEVDGVDVSTTYRAGGTDVALADGGTGASLTDPNADRIMFWDDSAGAVTWLTPSTGLTVSGTNMTVRTSSATQTGIVELATTAETTTATDTARAVTPAGIGAERSATATLTNKTISGASNTITDIPYTALPDGVAITRAFATLSSSNTTSSVIPLDDTVPQQTEGIEILTVSITPKLTTSKLMVRAKTYVAAGSSSEGVVTALFRDATSDAIAAGVDYSVNNAHTTNVIEAEVTSGSTSETTFKLRIGSNDGNTIRWNGSGGRYFGDIPKTSIEVIEYKA